MLLILDLPLSLPIVIIYYTTKVVPIASRS